MKHIFCDVCKKEISEPIPSRTIFSVREFDLCELCRDDLEFAVKGTVRGKKPFDFAWFDKLRVDLIQEGIKKNKISVVRQH